MNVLAFDTCLGAVSVAVRRRDEQGALSAHDACEHLAVGHAERLLPMIDRVMAAAGLAFDRLARIAVTIGPGGFTGLRVGVSAARALALATGAPVVGMSSLALLAAGADARLGESRAGRALVVAVDARRSALFVQMFGGDGASVLSDAAVSTVAEAAALLPAGPLVIVGSGAAALAAAAARADVEAALPDLQPHARYLADLAPGLPLMNRVIPLYLRPADAKPSSVPPLARRPGP